MCFMFFYLLKHDPELLERRMRMGEKRGEQKLILMYFVSPLALGSYWALLVSVLIVPVIVARILDEESALAKELNGYSLCDAQASAQLLCGA